MRISRRAERIEPFYVMEVAKAAWHKSQSLAPDEAPMIFLNIGEPDFTAPPLVLEAAHRALRDGKTQYTQATGLPALRERIGHWYAQRFGLQVAPSRIVVTAGASAALHLACLALIDAGDEILMPDPSYPCNRHFVSAAEGQARLLPTTAKERFQLNAAQVAQAWSSNTRGVLLASPSNPTGTSIDPAELARIHSLVQARGGITLVDEIYLGLSFESRFGQTALALDDNIISIGSFSKYFHMTGWRLGWLVVPEVLTPVIEQLAQHLFICPNTVAQYAALACFESASLLEFERRRAEFKARRDFFIPALNALGLTVPVMPDGAFYAWADCTAAMRHLSQKFSERPPINNSADFAKGLLELAHVAVTPGRDFGSAQTEQFIRFSTASAMPSLQQAVTRMQSLMA